MATRHKSISSKVIIDLVVIHLNYILSDCPFLMTTFSLERKNCMANMIVPRALFIITGTRMPVSVQYQCLVHPIYSHPEPLTGR